MLRLLCPALFAVSLLSLPAPVSAQAGNQPDRLSLEALTAPQPGDGHGLGYRQAYHRAYGGSYHPAAYRASRRYRPRHYAQPGRGGYRGGNRYVPDFYRPRQR